MWNPGSFKPMVGHTVYNETRYQGPAFDHRSSHPQGIIIAIDWEDDIVVITYNCGDQGTAEFKELEGRWVKDNKFKFGGYWRFKGEI